MRRSAALTRARAAVSSSRVMVTFFIGAPRIRRIRYYTVRVYLSLPHPIPLLPQPDRELDFHLPRRLVGHGVGVGIEFWQQTGAIALDEAVGALALLVFFEPCF